MGNIDQQIMSKKEIMIINGQDHRKSRLKKCSSKGTTKRSKG
jgi:hypothetical protein